MCKTVVVAGILAALVASGADAQGPTAGASRSARAEHERQVDSAGVAFRAALAALAAYDDSVARQRTALDSTTVGAFRLVVEPNIRGVAEAAARIAGARVARFTDDLSAVRGSRFVIRTDPASVDPPILTMALVDSAGVERGQSSGRADSVAVANWLYGHAVGIIGRALHPDLGGWLKAPMPFDTITLAQWSRQRIDLVSAGAAVARRCWEQDLGACKIAYGLVEASDPARVWYTARERQALVHRYSWSFRSYNSELAVSCMRGTDDDACARIINESGIVAQPIGHSHRVTLAQFAVRVGGAGALDRLKQTPGSAVRRLEAAAAMPIDSLLTLHHRQLRAARMPSDDISMPIVGMSLVWILVLGVLATRSSRWR